MAITIYTYLVTDTANSLVASDSLKSEIEKEPGILTQINSVSYDATNINIEFADILTGTQKADFLDVIIAAHIGVPLSKPPTLVQTRKETGEVTTQMAKSGGTCDSNGNCVIDVVVPGDNTFMKGGRLVAGGVAFFETYHIDSWIEVDLIHPVAGKVGSYSEEDASIKGWWVEPDGVVRVGAMDYFGSIPEGLIMRITGHHGDSATADGKKFKCNIQWGALVL